jgi:hypothetical protein
MRHAPICTFPRHPEASVLAVAILSLMWSPGCSSSDRQGAPPTNVERKEAPNSPSETSSNRAASSGLDAVAKALTAEQIQEQEQSVDRLVAAENSQLPARLEGAVDRLRLEALSESGDGYKHAESIQSLVFQNASADGLEGWRGVFLRPSSKDAFDDLLDVLRTHERVLEEFEAKRPSTQLILQWNEIVSRLNLEIDRSKDLRGKNLLPKTVTGLRGGRVQDISRVVPAQVAGLDGLLADLESSRKALEEFTVRAANFHKFREDPKAAMSAIDGILSELRQIPGQAGKQEEWNALAERWNKVAAELNETLDRSLALRQEPEFPPHALSSNQDLLAWLDGIDITDRDRSSRASAARDVRQAIDHEVEVLERVRLIDRTQLVAYHRSVVQALPSELKALDALTRFGKEIMARKDSDPNQWSQDAWLAAYVDLQDSAFGAIMAGAVGDHMDAATRNWAALTACNGWPLFLRSWAWDSMLGAGEKTALEARLRDWKAAAQAVGPKEAVDLDTYLGAGVLNVVPAEGRVSWRAVLAAVTAEHSLLDLPTGCIEPMNAQLAVRAAGLTSPSGSYHAGLVERFNRNRDVLDVSGMKRVLSEERDRRPEMWTEQVKLNALYADLQDLQLRAYFKASLSKTLPKVFGPFIWRKQPNDLAKFKEAARSQKLADVQGMLALIAGEAIDLARFKGWVQASLGYPQVSLTSPELWQALAQELGHSDS